MHLHWKIIIGCKIQFAFKEVQDILFSNNVFIDPVYTRRRAKGKTKYRSLRRSPANIRLSLADIIEDLQTPGHIHEKTMLPLIFHEIFRGYAAGLAFEICQEFSFLNTCQSGIGEGDGDL